MLLLLPVLLRQDMSFWLALVISVGLTVGLYAGAAWACPKLGIPG
jgi:hypothetical protein